MTRFTHCIVHAGTHKTGTTSVQDVLSLRRAELSAAGICYPALDGTSRDHNALAHRLATCADDELPALGELLMRAAAGVGARPGDGATLLLSAEELSTRIRGLDPWAGFDDGAYWEHRRQYLARLRGLLPHASKVEVFVCFRDHESYAHALYATKVLSGKVDWSFPEFVRRCAPIFDYARQAEVLAEVLGPVHVQSFETLRDDLVNRSFAWLGLPLRVERTPRLRPTPALDLIHWLARPADPRERARRAAFCRANRRLPDGEGAPVRSLWPSGAARMDFLRHCRPPPLQSWAEPPTIADPVCPAALERRADEIEAVYQQWRRQGGSRRPWLHFWRRW
jgi:hypothetical protein